MKLQSFVYRTNAKRRVTRRNRGGRRNENKGRERTKSLTGGEETATEIEIATETGTNVEAGEWTTIRVVMTPTVIGIGISFRDSFTFLLYFYV